MLRILAAALVTLALAGCTATASGHRPAHGVYGWHQHDYRGSAWDRQPHWRGRPPVRHARKHQPWPQSLGPFHARPNHGDHHHGPRRGPPPRHGWRR